MACFCRYLLQAVAVVVLVVGGAAAAAGHWRSVAQGCELPHANHLYIR